MKPEVISSTLRKMVNHKHLRKLLAKKIDDYIYKIVVEDDSEDLLEVRIKRYQFLSAMMRCVNRNISKGYVSKQVMKKIIDVLVQNNLIRQALSFSLLHKNVISGASAVTQLPEQILPPQCPIRL